MRSLPGGLLLVTDRSLSASPLPATLAACTAAGVNWVWLRDRDLAAPDRRALALAIKDVTSAASASLVVGADVDLALAIHAQGVHLPADGDIAAARARLGPGKLVGLSAHGIEDVRRAAAGGADYVTLSPIFESASKPGYGPALGLAAIEQAAQIGPAVVALGGVTPAAASACLAAGARAIAVMGGLLAASDPAMAARAYLRALEDDLDAP